jgi:hypothetical protein
MIDPATRTVAIPKAKPATQHWRQTLLDRIKIRNAKIDLYRLLLAKEPDDMSETEVDLLFTLSKDSDVQAVLSGA